MIERETLSRGECVPCEVLRPDVDWSVLRRQPELAAQPAPVAVGEVASA